MINVAIVGYGYWGRNLVRNFNSLSNCNLHTVCDSRETQREQVAKLYPAVNTVKSLTEVTRNEQIDAVVISTPVDTHYSLAKQSLLAGKHVLVEKPLTDSYETAKELVQLANSKNLRLMVDHTFLYTGAVQHLKKISEDGSIGKINYIDSTRINLGLFQHDVNVLWDLAPHDISICNYLVNAKPISVQASGISHTNNNIENIAYLTLKYPDNLIAHFNCSWVSPVKIRMMLIGGDKKMAMFNDMEPTEKIKVYDTGFDVQTDEEKNNIIADYRVGDINVPKIDNVEALKGMAADFIESIEQNKEPISNASLGLDVVQILDCAQQSIKSNGKEIKL